LFAKNVTVTSNLSVAVGKSNNMRGQDERGGKICEGAKLGT